MEDTPSASDTKHCLKCLFGSFQTGLEGSVSAGEILEKRVKIHMPCEGLSISLP